ncbi:MAG: hypothetical protein M3Z06_05565 [Actinomycetota bacterium]|nr:hypothetical protein [Actinomycetota bacterium]
MGPSAPPPALVLVLDDVDQGRGQRVLVVGLHQPAGLPVLDDRRGTQRAGGHRRQAAGHALDDDLSELLALGG